MDYSSFDNFPFPLSLSNAEETARAFFFALPDEAQLKMLNGCQSYEEFSERLEKQMEKD